MTKTCLQCDKEFMAEFERTVCCSKKCQKKRTAKLHYEANRKYRATHTDKVREIYRNSAKIYKERHPILYKKRRKVEMDRKHFAGLKYIAMERDNYTCQRCAKDISGKKKHHIHHVNGDHYYNTLENLITLCPSCHQKTHWEMKRMKQEV